jgi:uncharacterized protein YndB with AHSA1/START domain
MSASIHQEVVIKASPGRVYEALTDSRRFSEFTGGSPADISGEVGGHFSCVGGMIVGRQLELMPGRRIVQAWRAGNWDEGVFSIVRFELKSQGSDTRIVFDHTGYPEAHREHLDGGWHKMYWEPLKKYLG